MNKYHDAISFFTKANVIENIHNLNKRAITYYTLQEYDKALLDLNKAIQLDSCNSIAYYLKWLTYYTTENTSKAMVTFKKCGELDIWMDLLEWKNTEEYILKYEDLVKLEGLGWIEYKIPYDIVMQRGYWLQPIIEINCFIDMQIDYVQFIPNEEQSYSSYLPKMKYFISIHKLLPNVPYVFKDKYFSNREMEDLVELKNIIDNL
ncbi:hypothetical protein GLOIN_2v476919 [Rhizophagus clarus]|uniref:Uncharacterized protein n=1 Tax=Rhizophagus clarus TaxID=94130 RepID=A0A8H3QPD5_9GLOM|nr:hypothetical protein GLOIN_2v476919 [Rhizophagus clarus]